jgi:O-acetylhomoserine (thiol)-lyase
MPPPKPPAFETLSLHAGQQPDAATGARAVPIYQTTSYVFEDTDHAAALFNLERAGHIYSRISNPTVAVLEERLAALEGGVGAVCTASGQAALHLAIVTLLNAGDHIVASSSLYGGTINLLAHTLPRFGITTTFVKPRDLAAFRSAITPRTRLLIGETIGNPGLEVLDIPKVADIAHQAGVPLLIDNTFATPYLSQPIALGADIVMHSVTKWLGGHGIAIGGAIVDGGHFDWRASAKFPQLTEPYAGYHGMIFDEQFGPAAFIMRARTEGLRDFGACLSPTNAFHLLQGIETLHVRMDRHVANTAAVLDFLKGNKAVDWVLHPSLENHPDHALAKELLPRGAGSIVSFGIKGGRPAGRKFI